MLKSFQYDHNNVIRNFGRAGEQANTMCECVQVLVCLQAYVPVFLQNVCMCQRVCFGLFECTPLCISTRCYLTIHNCVHYLSVRDWECVRVRAHIQDEQSCRFWGWPAKNTISQSCGNLRGRNSSICFQTSFTLSEVKTIKSTHAQKHAHADKRVVSVMLVNRVSINLIVPT